MTLVRRLLVIVCCAALIFSMAMPVFAEESPSVRELLQQMLNYYYHYQAAGKSDVYRLLQQMEQIDPEQAARWQSIFEYWFYATQELPKNETELPDGLAEDDSLCIVVLGYRLYTDGGARPELIGRLQLALAAAQKYPNAYILCTGGGTAANAPNITEAHQMRKWLIEQGVDRDRIILESDSTLTIHNAIIAFRILTQDYPQVRQLAIVSSDYHLQRSSTLFFAQAAHTAAENGTEPLAIVACLGYEAGHEGGAEDPLDQTAHLARLSGFEFQRAAQPPLSRLEDITLTCDAVLEPGMIPNLTVMAHYDSGFSRDVTKECDISGFNAESESTQFLTVTYSELGVQIQASAEIRRPVVESQPPETQAPETQAPETVPATEPVMTQPKVEFEFPWPAVLVGAVVILAFLLFRKRK